MRNTLFLLFFLSITVFAQETSELSVTMKNIGLSYKQAVQATNKQELLSSLESLSRYSLEATKETFKPELKTQSLKGLQKVLDTIERARQLAKNGDMKSAQTELKKIDSLRKEYHKLHEPPSIWQLIFG